MNKPTEEIIHHDVINHLKGCVPCKTVAWLYYIKPFIEVDLSKRIEIIDDKDKIK